MIGSGIIAQKVYRNPRDAVAKMPCYKGGTQGNHGCVE
jgi:hypothetical protein